MKKKNIGSTFDSWLREQGLYENVSTTAIERINSAADRLNSEAGDVLEYQASDK
jgi:hypothetical protein